MAGTIPTHSCIYLQNTGREKRILYEIDKLIRPLAPNIKSRKSKATEKGYVFYYPNDKDINVFFKTEILNRLAAFNLTADLGKESQNIRVVFIPDVSEDTYNLDNITITDDIEARNNIQITKLDKFKSSKTNRLYLKIALDSCESCTNIINKGHISIFNERLQVQGIGNRSTQRADATAGVTSRHLSRDSTPSARTHGHALSSSSTWAGHRNQMYSRNPTNNNNQLNRPNQLHQIPEPPLKYPHVNDNSVRFIVEAASNMAYTLSKGMEDPYTYIDYCNQTYEFNGLPRVNIPQWIIDSSRDTFLCKLKMNNPTHHTSQHPPSENPPVPNPPEIPPVTNQSDIPPVTTTSDKTNPPNIPPVSTPSDMPTVNSPSLSPPDLFSPNTTSSSTHLSSTQTTSSPLTPTCTTTTTTSPSFPISSNSPTNSNAPTVSSATFLSEVAYKLRSNSQLVNSTPKLSTNTSPSSLKHQANIHTPNSLKNLSA